MFKTHLSRSNFARPVKLARMQNPAWPGGAYRNTDMLYDSFAVAQAAAFPTVTTMFQVPIGQAGKTAAQTNMRAAGTLANSENFWVKRMRVILSFNTALSDAINILQNVSVELHIGGRSYALGPVQLFPAGGGGNVQSAATTAATTTITGVSNGNTDISAAYGFEDEIEIGVNENVAVIVKAETGFNMAATASGGVGCTLTVVLDGRRLRKVA